MVWYKKEYKKNSKWKFSQDLNKHLLLGENKKQNIQR